MTGCAWLVGAHKSSLAAFRAMPPRNQWVLHRRAEDSLFTRDAAVASLVNDPQWQ